MKLSTEVKNTLVDTAVDYLADIMNSDAVGYGDCYLPALVLDESEVFWRKLQFYEARGWLTHDEAADMWAEYERGLQEILDEWTEDNQ